MKHQLFRSTTSWKSDIANFSKSTLKYLRTGSSLPSTSKVSPTSESSTNKSLRSFSSRRVLSMTKFLRNSQNKKHQIHLVQTQISQWKNRFHKRQLHRLNSSKDFNPVLTKDNRWWVLQMQSHKIVSLINSIKSRWECLFKTTKITSPSVNSTNNINNSFSSRFIKWLALTNFLVFQTSNKDLLLRIPTLFNTIKDRTMFHNHNKITTLPTPTPTTPIPSSMFD